MELKINNRISELGITLPAPPTPSANYVPYTRIDEILQLSGVAPKLNDEYAVVGKIGHDLSMAEGIYAARLCALNAISNLKAACEGNLDIVRKFVMIRGFVNATEDFARVPAVIDGASNIIIDVFGEEIGKHARTAIGCATLPSRVAVEIDCTVLIDTKDLSM